jgi:membrane protease YdiL (CAAX protease family)
MSGRRAWPVLVAFLAAFSIATWGSQVLVLAVARHGVADPDETMRQAARFARSVQGLSAIAALNLVVLSAAALITARLLDPSTPSLHLLRIGPGRLGALGLAASATAVSGLSLTCGSLAQALGATGDLVSRIIPDALAAASPWGAALAWVSLTAVPAIGEETFFRGLMQPRLCAAWGRWPGIVAAAAAFGVLHLDPVQGAMAFVVGILLGWIADRFGSIVPAIAAHAGNNALFLGLSAAHAKDVAPVAAIPIGAALTLASVVVLRSARSLALRSRDTEPVRAATRGA